MGMDSRWFDRFMDAYLDSPATDLPIWRVVRWRQGDSAREPITEELSREEAWKIVYRLREEDPAHAYGCEHNIAYYCPNAALPNPPLQRTNGSVASLPLPFAAERQYR